MGITIGYANFRRCRGSVGTKDGLAPLSIHYMQQALSYPESFFELKQCLKVKRSLGLVARSHLSKQQASNEDRAMCLEAIVPELCKACLES